MELNLSYNMYNLQENSMKTDNIENQSKERSAT